MHLFFISTSFTLESMAASLSSSTPKLFGKRAQAVYNQLTKHQQEHLLRFYDDLSFEEQKKLLEQLEAQDWGMLESLIENYVRKEPETALSQQIMPAPYYPAEAGKHAQTYEEAKRLGQKLIAEGKVAAFTVAGGQGTRLGYDGPKGMFVATASGKSLFQIFAEQLRKAQEKYCVIETQIAKTQATIPWYIMTSPMNDAQTRAFFKENNYFGLDSRNVMFFPQGTLPSIGLDGKLLLAGNGELALNADGHGGSLRALRRSGALGDMKKRGVEYLSYIQVDNPNVKMIDPLFIGLHALENAEMSAKMLPKSHAKEKVGNFCLQDGKVSIIEYSDMPAELAELRNDDGSLAFNAGSIAIHIISVGFIDRLTSGSDAQLPYHRAVKAVPFVDESGQIIKPAKPNAVKLERFIFDALPLAKHAIILETDRTEEFAPIKNAEGDDSPATSKQLQTERAARWLEQCNVKVPRDVDGKVDAVIEISPLTATEPSDLVNVNLPKEIKAGETITL
jgi:UDP-N-acetylglucosamine/UDP-N-acetylgalactosamine diphosphorylase